MADVSWYHKDGKPGLLTADCYQVTDLFEEQISAATYGDGCEHICKAVLLNSASERV